MKVLLIGWRYLNLKFAGTAKEIVVPNDIRYHVSYSVSGIPTLKHVMVIGKNQSNQWVRLGGDHLEGITTGFINVMGRALEAKL